MSVEFFTNKQHAQRGKDASLMPVLHQSHTSFDGMASKKVVRRRSDNADFGKLQQVQALVRTPMAQGAHLASRVATNDYCTKIARKDCSVMLTRYHGHRVRI